MNIQFESNLEKTTAMGFDRALKGLGMNKAKFAAMTGISANTISRWDEAPPHWAWMMLTAFYEVQKYQGMIERICEGGPMPACDEKEVA